MHFWNAIYLQDRGAPAARDQNVIKPTQPYSDQGELLQTKEWWKTIKQSTINNKKLKANTTSLWSRWGDFVFLEGAFCQASLGKPSYKKNGKISGQCPYEAGGVYPSSLILVHFTRPSNHLEMDYPHWQIGPQNVIFVCILESRVA